MPHSDPDASYSFPNGGESAGPRDPVSPPPPDEPASPGDAAGETIRHPPLPVLARGDGWIVVAKPPRVIVHRNPRMRRVAAVVQRVRHQVGGRVYLAHRLDRGTSGCLLLATDRARAGELSLAIASDAAEKTYIAFVRGCFPHDDPVVVDTDIPSPRGPKAARSTVELLGRSVEPRCSLLRVTPHTGRHHQVRRHVRDLHHPIIGDSDHGDSRINRYWRQRGADRLGLHCLALRVSLPGGERIEVDCPLFEDQAAVYRTLPWWEEALAREPRLGLPPLSMRWMYPIA
ncbi:MAG: hypothetical protein D6798_02245 [Deltaproteobacteria bacterium]|nr:MAG: hypothetical protein D6798_02245 [Deltaproteobacteria bacterium]